MRYQELNKEIHQNIFHPVYLFSGQEQYIAEMMVQNLIDLAVPNALSMMNVMRFSEKDTSPADVIAICQQVPMLSPYRVVIVEESAELLQRSDDTAIQLLNDYYQQPSPTTLLIFKESKPDKRKKTVKNLIQNASIVEFGKLNQSELEKWIAARLKKAEKQTTRSVVGRFIDDLKYLENDSVMMTNVDNELNKIIDYCGNRPSITMDDLDAVLPKSIDENIYRMIDHCVSGKMADALIMLRHFYLEGQEPIGIFALLIAQLRTMLQIQLLNQQHCKVPEIASQVKRPVFVVKKLLSTAKRFPGNTLTHLLEDAADADVQMKTGVCEPATAVELFILKIGTIPQ